MVASNPLLDSFVAAQSELVIQTADLPLGTLADMVDAEEIDLQPGFQRRERWNNVKQSALIESFLLNVPVPPIYLAEEADGRYTAIDGKQRLRAITDFLLDRFPLKELERLREAEGLQFQQLPLQIRNSLRLRPYLRVVTLLRQTNVMLKYEVFLRLNRGGESLNNQEIRNVAFRGPLNDKLVELSEQPFFRAQLKIHSPKSTAFNSMLDVEYVLRFLTLLNRYAVFTGNLAQEMNDFMARHQRVESSALHSVSDSFVVALNRCEAIWGPTAFKRPEGTYWRDQFLAGMYDAQMLSVARLNDRQFEYIVTKIDRAVSGTRRLFEDPEFDSSVRTATNNRSRIHYRVGEMYNMLIRL